MSMVKYIRYYKTLLFFYKRHGLKHTILFLYYKFLERRARINSGPGMAMFQSEIEVFDIGSYKKDNAGFTAEVPEEQRKTIPFVWYVPYWTNVWGGGHLTIFRFAHMLMGMGNQNIIYIYNNAQRDAKTLEADLALALPGHKLKVILTPQEMPENHVAFATTWQSAYEVIKYSPRMKKIYFMQDYESHFYPFGTMSLQANASYELGFHGITGGTWLKECYELHGGTANNYIFSTDHSIFYARENMGSEIKRLFFYGRPSTERRAYELGVEILRQINKQYPEIEIVIAGLDGLKTLDFPAKLLGNLTLKETGELYRRCDVGIALSATNLSYLPVELMACGVPVITNNGPQVEWFCEHMKNSMVCDPFPSAFVDAITKLKESPELRLSLAQGGIAKIAETSWENEARKIMGYVREALV
ncbi:MAG: hypothetical protein JWM96_1314 [Alphaproteobacteria bacterium]|nr:hypothetical protein [Alphaproteobacteria bacterium]